MQTYLQTVTVTNNLGATVDASIRCGSSDRYTVSPTAFSLKPGHSCTVEVSLRLLRFAQKRKAVEQGQRDVLHIKVCILTFFISPCMAKLLKLVQIHVQWHFR
jgi:hypothetical protein